MSSGPQDLYQRLLAEDAGDPEYASRFVEALLEEGAAVEASDLHLQPTAKGLELSWRIDGVLQPVGEFAEAAKTAVIARLKVLADLLTYRTDLPQEGRIRREGGHVEMRVSTFPTLHGEKAVVRLFAPDGKQFLRLDDLGLPTNMPAALRALLAETSGAILFCGPAGCGKTTTGYAALREIVAASERGRSVASLEDPVEVAVPGVSQSQVNEAAGFDLATGLRSLVRQDPQVIFVGEIRDRTAAEIAFQAALIGGLLVTTFHAPSAAGAISRLSDMGIEPYVLRSGILAIVAQRLARRLCNCARDAGNEDERLGLPVEQFRVAGACERCRGTGYQGRMVLAEMLTPHESELARAILAKRDARQLHSTAVEAGMVPLWRRACEAVEAGKTSPAEIRRVFGFAEVLES